MSERSAVQWRLQRSQVAGLLRRTVIAVWRSCGIRQGPIQMSLVLRRWAPCRINQLRCVDCGDVTAVWRSPDRNWLSAYWNAFNGRSCYGGKLDIGKLCIQVWASVSDRDPMHCKTCSSCCSRTSVGNFRSVAAAHINEVTLRRARLVLGWATDCSRVQVAFAPSRYLVNHPGQLSLAIHSWVGAMSTNDGQSHC